MAIDFSFLDGVAPQQQQQAAPQDDVANVTFRVDADAMLLCDGEYMDIHLKGGVITKVQLPVGQHLLEFLSEENPDVKVEKVADFPAAGKSYLVMVNELKAALEQSHSQAAVALGVKRVYRLVVTGYDNQMVAMMTARTVMGWGSAEVREKLAALPAVMVESEDCARIELLAAQFAKGNLKVAVETRTGLGELVESRSIDTAAEAEAKRRAAEEARAKSVAEAKQKAEAEEAKACYTTGMEYERGSNGKIQNYEEAFKWFRKGAELGNADAQFKLAECYEAGNVEKNGDKSYEWYLRALEQYLKAAEHGDAGADTLYKLGRCYIVKYYNKHIKGSKEEAAKWFRKAAELGSADAYFKLAWEASDKFEAEKCYAKAISLYTRAAEQGDADAQCKLGECYKDGKGVLRDEEESFRWYRMAAEQGNVEAQCRVGCYYVNGIYHPGEFLGRGEVIMKEDLKVAFNWFRKAAEQGEAEALYVLGLYYKKGHGVVDRNKEMAEKYERMVREREAFPEMSFRLEYLSLE